MCEARLTASAMTVGAKVVSQGRYVTFQMAEVAIPRRSSLNFCSGSPHYARRLPFPREMRFGNRGDA
jgi:hypothetical protein